MHVQVSAFEAASGTHEEIGNFSFANTGFEIFWEAEKESLSFLWPGSLLKRPGLTYGKILVLGFLTPMGGGWDGGRTHSGAVPVAIKKANQDPYLLSQGYQFAYAWKDSQCNAGRSLAAMSELLDIGVDVFIGPGCSTACELTQLLASNRNLVQVRPHLFPIALGRRCADVLECPVAMNS